MIKGELTPAAVVLTQRQNFLPPTEQLGPPLTHQGRRYHSGHGSSKKPDMVGIEPETSCAEAYTLTTRPNPTPEYHENFLAFAARTTHLVVVEYL